MKAFQSIIKNSFVFLLLFTVVAILFDACNEVHNCKHDHNNNEKTRNTSINQDSAETEKARDSSRAMCERFSVSYLELINQDSIIESLKNELSNNQSLYENGHLFYDIMIDSLIRSKRNNKTFFPYTSVDSILMYKCYQIFEPFYKEIIIYERKLSYCEINMLLFALNNPLLYHMAECGTPLPEELFRVFFNGKEKASITVSCDKGMIECNPNNILTKFGGLNSSGIRYFDAIIR